MAGLGTGQTSFPMHPIAQAPMRHDKTGYRLGWFAYLSLNQTLSKLVFGHIFCIGNLETMIWTRFLLG